MRQRLREGSLVILAVPVVLAIILFLPLLMIWSLNTLLALGIPYTVKTWLAMIVLAGGLATLKGSS